MIRFISIFIALSIVFLLPASVSPSDQISCDNLEKIFNTKVDTKNGVCSVVIPRKNIKVTNMGKILSSEMMSLALMANFEKVGGQVAVMGEFALLEKEVNPVIDELRKGNFEITAIHNHMISEKPKLIFVHFQGMGDMNELAESVKSAIDEIES